MTTFGTPAEAVTGMRHSPIWSRFESVAPTLAYDDALMRDGSVPKDLMASVAIPTLVMDGGGSPSFMHDAVQAAAGALPNAQRRTLKGQSHDVAPEALAAALIEFFS